MSTQTLSMSRPERSFAMPVCPAVRDLSQSWSSLDRSVLGAEQSVIAPSFGYQAKPTHNQSGAPSS